ncbi:MAG: dihydrolipoamide acetyltransferase family protein [Candidatus Methylacidiphilales bacterium]|nr:dihydrolipoamide acetyltransferase family protein [Candidatus Methylacidiphilales bacterium]
MPTAITMPKLSDTMTEGTVVKWLKQEGDTVNSGDVIAEIETDKATMDLEAFDSGVLLKILAPAGTAAACKAPIAFIGEKGEKIDEAAFAAASVKEAAPASASAPAVEPVSAPALPLPTPQAVGGLVGRAKASPLARKIAAENGVDLSRVTGTGPGGRIVKKDVLALGSTGGSGGSGWLHATGYIGKGDERVPLTNMRKTIAKRLQQSKQTIPHFYQEMEIDMGPCMALRAVLNARLEKTQPPVKLSFNDFVLKACAVAMRKAPVVNAFWEEDAVRMNGSVHLAFGVAIPGGLITPVIPDAQDKNLKQISLEAKELAARAKEGKLKPEEYTTGTFTVSNLGMFGVDRFSAIVNPPQAAILAVGNIVAKPVVDANGQIVVGQRMSLTLSADHRVVDGADAAIFLKEVKDLLEAPALLVA